jgi:hypothetical protein
MAEGVSEYGDPEQHIFSVRSSRRRHCRRTRCGLLFRFSSFVYASPKLSESLEIKTGEVKASDCIVGDPALQNGNPGLMTVCRGGANEDYFEGEKRIFNCVDVYFWASGI